eukprot:364618-Chlamydomonas_euryale.AAC.7
MEGEKQSFVHVWMSGCLDGCIKGEGEEVDGWMRWQGCVLVGKCTDGWMGLHGWVDGAPRMGGWGSTDGWMGLHRWVDGAPQMGGWGSTDGWMGLNRTGRPGCLGWTGGREGGMPVVG